MASAPKHVVVAGAGILGASIAWHLAEKGAEVTVIDSGQPGATAGSFGWINPWFGKRPQHYHHLNQLGVEAWQDLAPRLKIPITWGGCLAWEQDPTTLARESAAWHAAIQWSNGLEPIDRDALSRAEPLVVFADDARGVHSSADGWVDAAAATRALLTGSLSNGGEIRTPCIYQSPKIEQGRLVAVNTSDGEIPASHLVVACGASPDAYESALGFAVPQAPTAGVVATTNAMQPLISNLLVSEGVHVYQTREGKLVMGAAAPLAAHAQTPPTPAECEREAMRIKDVVARFLPAATDAAIESFSVAWRPIPADGLPAAGARPRISEIYTALTHSGVTLAIVLGRLIAQEITDATPAAMLEPYRPERFRRATQH
tara:strand:- start:40469 stop:41584 length:1116 start_codon:yes stop_codon:yes gene_type:complete